jgi:hypothetical protein
MAPIRPPMLRAPRSPRWVLWLVPFLVAADTDETRVRLARAEGALESVEKEASTLSSHAKTIVASGHFQGMAQLDGDSLALHRQVVSAKLAIDSLRELDPP